MDIQNFKNGNHRFPVSTDALDFMQNQIFLTAKLASIAGTNVIIKPATTSQDGLVVIEGELLPLQKGTVKSYINIVETPESITAGTITFDNVRIRRVAQYATSGYAVSNFTTLDTIVNIMHRVSGVESAADYLVERVDDIEDEYMKEAAIKELVTSTQNTLQTAIDATNTNVTNLINWVQAINDTYVSSNECDSRLEANARHHMPKGSIIDWYGTCRAANVPYGFVPCGIVCKGLSESAVNAEVTEWRNKYPNNITVSSVYSRGWALRITECNGQVVPDLTNRFIVHAGCDYWLGDTGGKDSVKLTSDQSGQPGSRIHSLSQTTGKAYSGTSASQHDCVNTLTWGTENAQDAVSSHENRPPYYALYKLIKVI